MSLDESDLLLQTRDGPLAQASLSSRCCCCLPSDPMAWSAAKLTRPCGMGGSRRISIGAMSGGGRRKRLPTTQPNLRNVPGMSTPPPSCTAWSKLGMHAWIRAATSSVHAFRASR